MARGQFHRPSFRACAEGRQRRAVMPEELLAQLADEFGRSITSAPSTPHFIIRADGSYTELATGIHSAEELREMGPDAGYVRLFAQKMFWNCPMK